MYVSYCLRTTSADLPLLSIPRRKGLSLTGMPKPMSCKMQWPRRSRNMLRNSCFRSPKNPMLWTCTRGSTTTLLSKLPMGHKGRANRSASCITGHLFGSRGTSTLTKPDHRGLVYDLSGVKHRTRLYMIFYFGSLMSLRERIRSTWRRILGNSAQFHVRGSRLNDYGKDSVVGFRTEELEKDTISTCAKLFKAVPNNDNQVAAECMDHLVAGVDTTGDAMCITMWRMSTPEYSHVQDRLYEELKSIEHFFDPVTGTAPISELEKLPYLDAVIHEGLRWRAPVPMTLFRIVPAGGADIAGKSIPAGCTVGCQAYSLHRKEDIFPNPDLFDPTRWLTKDPHQLSAMKTHFWPFSSGARMCLGHK
jgi:hypothetical protein